jgi:MFS family permease
VNVTDAITQADNQSAFRPTPWGVVILLIGAGMLASAQMGKVHIALPFIRRDLSLSLFQASWLLSALNILSMIGATLAGAMAGHWGPRKYLLWGLFIIAIAGCAGAASPNGIALLATRVVEGLGFMAVVVAAPSLLAAVVHPCDMKMAFSAWATYMPGGIALITLVAPVALQRFGWRGLWVFVSLLVTVCLVALAHVTRNSFSESQVEKSKEPLADLRAVLFSRGPLMLALMFATYTTQHLAVMGFMPTILVEKAGLSATRAGLLTSIAMAANIVGNLSAGLLLRRGVHREVLIALTSLFMGFMTIGIFKTESSFELPYICCFLFSCVGGIIPAALLGAAPVYAPSKQLIPATNGLLVQGANLGIVFGPPLLSIVATRFGWRWVPVETMLFALAGAGIGAMLPFLSRNQHLESTRIAAVLTRTENTAAGVK